MEAGALRHRVQIQGQTQLSTTTRGQAVITWINETTVWASINALAGQKAELARQLVPSATHEIEIRYLTGMNVRKRVLSGTRVFNIGHLADPEERHERVMLTVTEEIPPEV